MEPVVVAVAITGSAPRKKDHPAVPIMPPEQVESTKQAYDAGATLAHIHVRWHQAPLPRDDRTGFDRGTGKGFESA